MVATVVGVSSTSEAPQLPATGSSGSDQFPQQYARSRRFTLGAPRTFTVAKDGTQVLFLRSKSANDPVLCLWTLDTISGQEILLVDPATLGTQPDSQLPAVELARRERARESATGIVSYSLNDESTRCVFSLSGSLYLLDLDRQDVSALDTADGVFDPRLSPTGDHVAYVAGKGLHLLTLGPAEHALDSRDQILKDSREPDVSWGRAEFVAGEEMGRTRGFWWSPAGNQLLITRVDESAVLRRWISDPANPDQEPNPVRYPAAGTKNATVDLALVDLDGTTKPVDWQEGTYEYLLDVIWVGDHPPLIVRQTRDQRTVSMVTLDLATLDLKEIHTVHDPHWVEPVPGSPQLSSAGLLTIQDIPATQGGPDHRALCLNGRPLSPSSWQIRALLAVGDDYAVVSFSSDPTEIHLATVPLDGSPSQALTTEPGVHGATLGGSTLVLTSSLADRPGSRTTIHTLPPSSESGREIREMGEKFCSIANRAEQPAIAIDPTYLQLGPNKTRAALFLPEGYDPTEGCSPDLPVLLDPYGGPHAQRVLKGYNAHLVSQWFANQGLAVLVADGRGTPGRGPNYERQVWGDLAQPALEDQIEALDAAAEIYPFLDLTRVGIRGWSFGGYLAALAVLRRPDRVHVAIAGAPVTEWGLYDTYYTERYLGLPAQYPEHYQRSDLTDEAANLGAPLLLIHGLADDNVVAAHTLRLSSALLASGRAHQMLPLSGVTHMTPQQVVAENLLLLQRDFLLDRLLLRNKQDLKNKLGGHD